MSHRGSAIFGAIILMVGACGSATTSQTVVPPTAAAPSAVPLNATPGPTIAVVATPASAPTATLDPLSSMCEAGCQGRTSPGTFTTVGFLPGLDLDFTDDAWFDTADYPDELQFDQVASTDNVLRFWLDPKASTKTDQLLASVPGTAKGLTKWMVGNSDMVVSKPETASIGDGISATTFTVLISDSNKNVDPGCPSDVKSCLSFVWVAPGHTFAIGGEEAVRLYLFSVGSGSDAYTMVIWLDAPDAASLAKMTADVAPILKTVRLP
jgi:hypothetical protein